MYKKTPLSQHESQQDDQDYTLYSSRLEPKGPDALAPAKPKQEYSMWHAAKQEIRTFAEFIGLPGFIMKSSFNALYPDQRQGKDVYLQGSRQMDSVTRQYYERSLGAGMFVSPMTENGLVGYSEPFRRFVQHEGFAPQVNEIANDMPSWIPGDDHLIDFKKGDPYVKVDEGYARLPGGGSIYRWTRTLPPDHIQNPHTHGRLRSLRPAHLNISLARTPAASPLVVPLPGRNKNSPRTRVREPGPGPSVPHPQKLTSRARRQPATSPSPAALRSGFQPASAPRIAPSTRDQNLPSQKGRRRLEISDENTSNRHSCVLRGFLHLGVDCGIISTWTGGCEPRSAICRTLEARLPRTQKVKCRTSGGATEQCRFKAGTGRVSRIRRRHNEEI
jgi:hypothetical protein